MAPDIQSIKEKYQRSISELKSTNKTLTMALKSSSETVQRYEKTIAALESELRQLKNEEISRASGMAEFVELLPESLQNIMNQMMCIVKKTLALQNATSAANSTESDVSKDPKFVPHVNGVLTQKKPKKTSKEHKVDQPPQLTAEKQVVNEVPEEKSRPSPPPLPPTTTTTTTTSKTNGESEKETSNSLSNDASHTKTKKRKFSQNQKTPKIKTKEKEVKRKKTEDKNSPSPLPVEECNSTSLLCDNIIEKGNVMIDDPLFLIPPSTSKVSLPKLKDRHGLKSKRMKKKETVTKQRRNSNRIPEVSIVHEEKDKKVEVIKEHSHKRSATKKKVNYASNEELVELSSDEDTSSSRKRTNKKDKQDPNYAMKKCSVVLFDIMVKENGNKDSVPDDCPASVEPAESSTEENIIEENPSESDIVTVVDSLLVPDEEDDTVNNETAPVTEGFIPISPELTPTVDMPVDDTSYIGTEILTLEAGNYTNDTSYCNTSFFKLLDEVAVSMSIPEKA